MVILHQLIHSINLHCCFLAFLLVLQAVVMLNSCCTLYPDYRDTKVKRRGTRWGGGLLSWVEGELSQGANK